MKKKLAAFYGGANGEKRLRALQNQLNHKILFKIKPTEKVLLWSVVPNMTGGEFCPFADNHRPPYGNGALDHVVIIHCMDVTEEANGLMAEASRMVRDHGLIDVIGWTKPKYDMTLPLWERERHRLALRWLDPWSLKWRRYEKVQDLLTLTFTGEKSAKASVPAAAVSPRACCK